MEGAGHYIGVFRDITARKRAVEALRTSESSYRVLGEALAREASFVRLLQDVAVAANQSAYIEEALQRAIDLICEHTGWPIGHAYMSARIRRATSSLRPSGTSLPRNDSRRSVKRPRR